MTTETMEYAIKCCDELKGALQSELTRQNNRSWNHAITSRILNNNAKDSSINSIDATFRRCISDYTEMLGLTILCLGMGCEVPKTYYEVRDYSELYGMLEDLDLTNDN